MRLHLRVLVPLSFVVALSACAAEPPLSPESPTPTVTVTVTATAPAPAPTSDPTMLDMAAFQSGSTSCEFGSLGSEVQGVGCQMLDEYTYALPERYVEYGIPCSSISLGYEETLGRLGCSGELENPDARRTAPLPPGTVVSHGGIMCTLLVAGVTCTNTMGGVATITPDGYVAATD